MRALSRIWAAAVLTVAVAVVWRCRRGDVAPVLARQASVGEPAGPRSSAHAGADLQPRGRRAHRRGRASGRHRLVRVAERAHRHEPPRRLRGRPGAEHVRAQLLRDGFYAPTQADELEAPGLHRQRDDQDRGRDQAVLGTVTLGRPARAVQRHRQGHQGDRGQARKGGRVRCRVASMFGGRQYVKYTTFEIRDVRIVYVPPEAIGNYGGETDNWMWPRHTGRFRLPARLRRTGRQAGRVLATTFRTSPGYLPISAAGSRTPTSR